MKLDCTDGNYSWHRAAEDNSGSVSTTDETHDLTDEQQGNKKKKRAGAEKMDASTRAKLFVIPVASFSGC